MTQETAVENSNQNGRRIAKTRKIGEIESRTRETVWYKIESDGMAPTLRRHMAVECIPFDPPKKWQQIVRRGVYIIRWAQRVEPVRFDPHPDKVCFLSDNKAYPTLTFTGVELDDIEVLGQVMMDTWPGSGNEASPSLTLKEGGTS